MAIRELKEQIAALPEQPGVYLYLNAAGDTIYVGKARVLRDRVRSYLGARGTDPKTDALLDEAVRLEVIVTDSVGEALALENNLIKQRSPKYNILLRDDKSYPYLQLTTNERFPRVLVARRVDRDGGFYAGPFLPASFARRTITLTHRLFGLRSCNEVITGHRGRPCLEYDIKRCLAPCVETICSAAEYGQAVNLARLFLEGRNEELVSRIGARMQEAAAGEQFEEAAAWRDAIRAVQAIHERQQKMATTALGHRDVFGLKRGADGAIVQVFEVRGGRVVERVELGAGASIAGTSDAEVVDAALQQFYELRGAPPEVHVPAAPDTLEALEAWLSARAGHRVRIVAPQRGDKRALVELANRNAALAYQARFAQGAANVETLAALRAALALPAVPRRIECFDVSTIQGRETVASLVVCVDGRMERSEYRKFRIRGAHARKAGEPAPDDFAAMREVVGRRGRRLVEQGGPFPDLVIVDGGRGQVSAAYDALETLGLANLVVAGLAKREEQLHVRDRPEPIALDPADPALLLVQRIRDEAHRFAITFHRRSRSRRDLASALDEVPGVGPRRRRTLLTRFGSVAGVRRATREELASAVGVKVADAVLAFFAGRP
jgi:excinuclease ABC subunit C